MHNFDKMQWMEKVYAAYPTELTQNNKSWKFQLSWTNPSQNIFSQRRKSNFSAVWKLAEKYSLVGMNYQGTLGRVYKECLYANSSSWCSLEANRFYFIFQFYFILFVCFSLRFFVKFIHIYIYIYILLFFRFSSWLCLVLLFWRHNKLLNIGAFFAPVYIGTICAQNSGVIYTKWDPLCPSYSGVIFPLEWDHLCRAASSERTIAIFVCMFFGSFVFCARAQYDQGI